MIEHRFAYDQNNFTVEKFITVTTSAFDRKMAKRQLKDVETNLRNQFQGVEVTLTAQTGSERLNIFSDLLRGNPYLNLDYQDLVISGLKTKSFVAPNRIRFFENYMMIDDKFAKIMFIRQYPSFLNDGIVVYSLVNTFASARNAESVMLTVGGKPLQSGHNIYDYALTPTN